MFNLGNRLKTVSQFVRRGSSVVDIGTDHAYLPVYLVTENISEKALACDLRKGPLFNAQKTVEQNNLTDKIELRLSDGLEKVNPDDGDDILICGMGGILITDILSKAEWLKNPRYRLVLQPQSHCEQVRRFLTCNGFDIINEKSCEESGKLYNVIVAEYSGDVKEYPDWFYYFGSLIYEHDEISCQITDRTIKLLKIKAEAQSSHNVADKIENIDTIIKDAEEILRNKTEK